MSCPLCNNPDPHLHQRDQGVIMGGSRVRLRYEPRIRKVGRWPFRRNSWQVWDNASNEWAPNALCGGALVAAMAACEGLNGHDTP